MKKILIFFIIVILIVIAIWRMQSGPRLEEQRRVMMDTYVTIYAYGPRKILSKAIDQAFLRMQQTANKFNAHNPDSPIYAFNHKGTPIRDREILKVVRMALEVSRQSDGAFDITVYPLVKLWGFYGEPVSQPPAEEKIRKTLTNVGYNHLILSGNELKAAKENIAIDLGGIAKGYVVGQGIEALKEAGINSAVVQGGGDVYALGTKNGKPWKVGIKHPRKDGLIGYLEVEDLAVMGSGDYERFFVEKGQRYGHIINPITGYPENKTIGVTVIYPDPTIADAWGTALFVLGSEKGLSAAQKVPGLEFILVSADGNVSYSPGLEKLMVKVKVKKASQ